ncbi:MAG TPA: class I SAM-dependent methyltransferase [Gaiellales bacterium]|jgi:ubiquinone/menaquinone biosynthesis C-methylase UbiE|nr:class I SAM-dependent methyltransferase [Gaiellales bacterium]
MSGIARYDGLAEWYRDWSRGSDTLYRDSTVCLTEMLGPGPGRCLDLACGGGRMVPHLVELGWTVVGCDVSADQLRLAREQLGDVAEFVQADAARLPFCEDSFDAVATALAHTDMDDLAAAFGECARVLRPGGALVHVGSHPCFCSPFAVRETDGRMVLHRGYSDTRWRTSGPAIGDGIRRRAGVRHVPLAELLNTIASAGLVLVAAREAAGDDFPRLLSLRAERPV